jgi:uncharacterized protein YkwD
MTDSPRRHRTHRKRGLAAPILAAFAVLGLLVASGWYVTRDGKDSVATGQNEPLTVVTDDTAPADGVPATTPTRTPLAKPGTPTKTPTKTPRATPTPTRSTTAPSRGGSRTPKPTTTPTQSPTPSRTRTPSTRPTTTTPTSDSGTRESQVLQLTNDERAKAGCGPLRTNSALTRAAEAHAVDMVVKHYFDHTSLDGRSPFDRMKAAGFPGGAMAENIAVGYTSAAAVVEGWMNSEGHRKNILNCDYTMIGIGYDSGQVKPAWGNGSWVQDFGG